MKGALAPEGKVPVTTVSPSQEIVDLTERKAWTVGDVRRLLPEVSCLVAGEVCSGRVTGRLCDFAVVSVEGHVCEFAWSTIAAALNNGRSLRF